MGQSTAASASAPYFDISDPAFSVQSEEVRRARESGWYARTNYGIAVLRHDEVGRLLKHPLLAQGSARWPAHHGITSGPFAAWWANWVLNKEGEDHRRLRRLLNPAFSRRLVDPLVPRFQALAAELIGAFREPDRCEFMGEFAEPYAARVIAIMLGLPEEHWPELARTSATIGLAMGVTIRADLPRIEAALDDLYGYTDELIAARRRDPRDDFVTRLAQAQHEQDRLSPEELRDSLVLLVFGGFDTTRNQLGLAMRAFLDHPDQWRLLGERPELGRAAVEEVMRTAPTTTWVTREAREDFAFEGLDIAAGTTVHLFAESAGTDPLSVPDGRFDITAERPPHFGFGGGAHHCLGHFVARADMSEALPLLARHLRDPRPGGEQRWLPLSGNTGPVTLPVAFTPRSVPPTGSKGAPA
ncbi:MULTISPECIES: cytochrome P450 [Thermomonosporaceae]|uniref:cytochrome P450 n=1 Tax=Thermomonosporaceae TaxID=2012 RepID=UPI00255B31BB|nr:MULTISPECIES: cytochrome P450 [Thermomonosporaceae]MDL4776512.1 cytochrome P450 [Actinomadura xylanilytica]